MCKGEGLKSLFLGPHVAGKGPGGQISLTSRRRGVKKSFAAELEISFGRQEHSAL